MKPLYSIAFAVVLLYGGGLWTRGVNAVEPVTSDFGAASSIVDSLHDGSLRGLVIDALERNPHIAILIARARAAEQRAPQERSLPDPTASLTLYLLEPQTRVGPQRGSVGLSQRLPGFGKLKLKEQMALLKAVATWARVDAARLELTTRVRGLYHELQFLDREERIVVEDRTTLEHYEELAQARYASGVGIGQTVIKIQAEITRARTRVLDIDERRAALFAEINALRDRPEAMPVSLGRWTVEVGALPPFDSMRETALSVRPELAEVQALIDAAGLGVDLAAKGYRPEFAVGLNYASVGKREDAVGRINPPEGNGGDIFGLTGGISLPVWRNKLAAGVDEAVQERLAAEESRRAITAQIEGELADPARRIPLIREQHQLIDEVLTIQAEESLHSAESAYASGTASALDLLDAERVLLGVRVAAERSRTDLAVAAAHLEGALAVPLETLEETEGRHEPN